jgi:hypothetical protein
VGLGDIIGNLKLARQIQTEIKEPGFSFKVMFWKATKTVGYALLGVIGIAVSGWLMNTPAVTDSLKHAGLSDAMAGALGMGLLWAGKAIANAINNAKTSQSPVDGQPINVQAAQKSGPVLTTEAQHDVFIEKYNELRNQGVPFETARTLALSFVTGLALKEKS